MKIIILLMFMLLSNPLWAEEDARYLQAGKVQYELPLEEDVLKVNTAIGYCTVLEFPEKPMLVTVGDNALIQVEIPQNSKSVVIKPLVEAGETNLFVFTPNQRFNYSVVIGDPKHVDYVLDSKKSLKDASKEQKKLSIGEILKIAKGYEAFKSLGVISERDFTQKNIFSQCLYPKISIDIIEAFNKKNPHYLLLHIVVRNLSENAINLKEGSSNIFINEQKFTPRYVLFDEDKLAPSAKTDGWLVLENSFISIDNKFSLSIGVEDEEYVCKQSVS